MIENKVTVKRLPDAQDAGTLTVKINLELDLENPERLAAGIARVMNFIAVGCSPEEFARLLNDIQAKLQLQVKERPAATFTGE